MKMMMKMMMKVIIHEDDHEDEDDLNEQSEEKNSLHITTVQKTIFEHEETIKELNMKLDEKHTEMEEIKESKKNSDEKFIVFERIIRDLKSKLHERRAEMEVLRNTNEKFSEDKKNYEAKIRELERDYDMSEDAIKSKERKIHALETELTKINEDIQEKMKCLDMEYNLKVQEMEATVGELSRKCNDTVKKNEESEEEIKELKGKLKECSQVSVVPHQKKDSMERENYRLKKKNLKLKKENYSLKKEIDASKTEYEYLRIKYSNKKNLVEFLEGEVFGRPGEKSTKVKVEKCTSSTKRPGEYFEPECSEEKRRKESVTEITEDESLEAGSTNGNGTEISVEETTEAGDTNGNGTETSEEETTAAGATNGNGTESPEKGATATGTTE